MPHRCQILCKNYCKSLKGKKQYSLKYKQVDTSVSIYIYLFSTCMNLFQKRKNFSSVGEMKDFVANDLRKLNQSKANLSYRKFTQLLLRVSTNPYTAYFKALANIT